MPDSPTNPSRPPLKKKHLFGCVGIACVLYVILFSGVPTYNESKAEEALLVLSDRLSQAGKVLGNDGHLQYSHVEVQGFAYEKWAEVSQLSMDFIRQRWLDTKRFGLSSDNVQMIPHHSDSKRIQLRFTDAINLLSGSDLVYVLTHNLPITYTVADAEGNSQKTIEHHLSISKEDRILFTNPQRAITVALKDPFAVDLTLPAPYNNMLVSLQGGGMDIDGDSGKWNIASSYARFYVSQKTPKITEMRGTFMLDELSRMAVGRLSTPLNLNVAWVFAETRGVSGGVEFSEFTIERSVLTDDSLHIAASGTLSFSMDDVQPYGEVTLEINDIKQLAASDWIADRNRQSFIDMLQMIIGQRDLNQRAREVIPIRRDKNGSWQIGKASLASLVEKGLFEILIPNQEDPNEKNTAEDNNPA